MSLDIRHIVFDIGHVLVHWDPEIPYRELIPDAGKRRWFFENVCTGQWNLEQDRGRPWHEGEALLIARFPDWENEIRAYRARWRDMVSEQHDHHANNIAHLRRLIGEGRDVTMLTNFASDTFEIAKAMFDFLNEPRGVTVSGDVKLIKPDPEIYRLHAQSMNLVAAHALFIDDRAENVTAAQNAGWQAIHYRGDGKLGDALAAFGLG